MAIYDHQVHHYNEGPVTLNLDSDNVRVIDVSGTKQILERSEVH